MSVVNNLKATLEHTFLDAIVELDICLPSDVLYRSSKIANG